MFSILLEFDFSKSGATTIAFLRGDFAKIEAIWIVGRKEERKKLKLELKSSYPARFSKWNMGRY